MKAFMTDPVVRGIAMMLVVVMGLVGLVPRVEASFVPSDQCASSISRQEDMTTIERALEQKLVRQRLKDLGYTDEEIKARVDQLSDSEIHSPVTQIDPLMPAGDGFEVAVIILLVIVLVVLIFLVMGKRIVLS